MKGKDQIKFVYRDWYPVPFTSARIWETSQAGKNLPPLK